MTPTDDGQESFTTYRNRFWIELQTRPPHQNPMLCYVNFGLMHQIEMGEPIAEGEGGYLYLDHAPKWSQEQERELRAMVERIWQIEYRLREREYRNQVAAKQTALYLFLPGAMIAGISLGSTPELHAQSWRFWSQILYFLYFMVVGFTISQKERSFPSTHVLEKRFHKEDLADEIRRKQGIH